jgi:hypothetical protein
MPDKKVVGDLSNGPTNNKLLTTTLDQWKPPMLTTLKLKNLSNNGLKKDKLSKLLLMSKPREHGHKLSKRLKLPGEHLLTTSMVDQRPLSPQKLSNKKTSMSHGIKLLNSIKPSLAMSLISPTIPDNKEPLSNKTFRLTLTKSKLSTLNGLEVSNMNKKTSISQNLLTETFTSKLITRIPLSITTLPPK